MTLLLRTVLPVLLLGFALPSVAQSYVCEIALMPEGGTTSDGQFADASIFLESVYDDEEGHLETSFDIPIRAVMCQREDLIPTMRDLPILQTGLPLSLSQDFVSAYTATPDTNRMGSRLRGNKIELIKPLSMTSSPLLPGTLQLPPQGQPILALIDGHCTGGYARCLQIIRADLWQLGQVGPGTRVSFRRCFLGEDKVALARRNEFYAGLMPGFSF